MDLIEVCVVRRFRVGSREGIMIRIFFLLNYRFLGFILFMFFDCGFVGSLRVCLDIFVSSFVLGVWGERRGSVERWE